MKKKILIFNGWYLPSKNCGGPVTSIRNVVNTCNDEYDFYIVALNHDFGSKEKFKDIYGGWNEVENSKVLYINDHELDFNKRKIGKLLEELHPDLIWFSGVLHPEIKLVTIFLANQQKIPVLFSPRGEVSPDRVENLKPIKKKLFLNILKHLGVYNKAYFHVTSNDERIGLRQYLDIKDQRIFEAKNISSPPKDYRNRTDKTINSLKCCFISRIHEVKQLDYALRILKDVKAEIVFDIYGPKESKDYWNKCQLIIDSLPENISVNYMGVLTPDEVRPTFSFYDAFIFPTLNENYGHVIAEALSVGCSVILSKGTTPWDDLNEIAGFVIEMKNKLGFANAIESMAKLNSVEAKELRNSTRDYYSKKLIKDNSVNIHKEMFNSIIEKGSS